MIRKPTILMWTFLLLCGMLGAGQPWLRLLSMWTLLATCWLEVSQVKTTRSLNVLISIALVWWTLLLIPLPLSIHSLLLPEISMLRNPVAEFLQIKYLPLAIHPSIHLLDGTSLLLFGWILLSTRKLDVEHWISFLCITGVLLVWIGWLHKFLGAENIFGIFIVPDEMRSPYFAPFINSNHAGYLFCALIPCAVRFQASSIVRLIIIVHFLLAILMTESRGAISLSALILLLELPIHRSVLVLGGIVMGSILWFWAPSLNSITHGRLDLWEDTLSALALSMPIGTGFGGFSDVYAIVKSTPEYSHSTHAHQEYLEWIVSTGIIGIILPLVGIVKCFQQSLMTFNETQRPFMRILLVFALAGLVDFPLQLNALLLLAFVSLKILLQETHNQYSGTIYARKVLLLPSALVILTSALWLTNSTYGMPLESDPIHVQVHKDLLNETRLTKLLVDNIETDPTSEGLDEVIQIHAEHHPTNIETQKTLARWHQSTEDFEKSCLVWNHIWSLETPILGDKLDLVPEALACDRNIWNAVIALPDDVDILVRAYQTLLDQKIEDPAIFCLKRAHDLKEYSVLGSMHYVQWLIQTQNWKRAWIEHNSIQLVQEISKSQHCLHLKNTAKLGFHFSEDQNPKQFQNLLDTCGQAPHWKRRLVLAELKSGKQTAIQTATEWIENDPKDIRNLWKFLAHAEQLNGNYNSACQWVQKAFHSNPKRVSTEIIQRCAQETPPFQMEIWKVQSKKDISTSIQTTIGPKPL